GVDRGGGAWRGRDGHRPRACLDDTGARGHGGGRVARNVEDFRRSSVGPRDPGDAGRAETCRTRGGGRRLRPPAAGRAAAHAASLIAVRRPRTARNYHTLTEPR